MLYSNPQFRALIHDGSILARDILSDVVEATATAIAPEEADLIELEDEAVNVDGRAIKDDVDDTKRMINENIESTKQQIKQTYDEATTSAMSTIRDLQAKGQKFGQEVQAKADDIVDSANEMSNKAVAQGKARASETAESLSKSADQAISKLAETSGYDEADIRDKLNNGISVDELMELAQSAGNAMAAKGRETASNIDQKGGKLIDQTSDRAAEFAKRNDVKGKANSAIEQGKTAAKGALDSAQAGAEQLQSKGRKAADQAGEAASSTTDAAKKNAENTVGDLQEQGSSAKDKSLKKASSVSESAQLKVDDAKQTTMQSTDSAVVKAKGFKDEASKEVKASTQALEEEGSSNSGNHLQELGIIHPTSQDNSAQGQSTELLEAIVQKLQNQIEGVKGVSRSQLEDAARNLIERVSSQGTDLEARVQNLVAKADTEGGQMIQEASQSIGNATEQAEDAGKDAASKISEVSEDAKSTTKETIHNSAANASKLAKEAEEASKQLTAKGQEIAKQAASNAQGLAQYSAQSAKSLSQDARARIMQEVDSIDATDLQEAVNNLLHTAKQVLEEKTGTTADDARQSLDWAIQRGEELAEQAMRQGRAGGEQVQKQAGEFISMAKQKTQQAGETAQNSLVTVGAQAKHALQNAPKNAPGQIHDTLDASQAMIETTVEAIQESTSEIRDYLQQKFPPKRRQAIQKHFQGLAVALRDNSDYSNGLDGLISIGKKYVDYTLTFTEEIPSHPSDVVSTNDDLDTAVKLTLQLIERFSNGIGFKGVQGAYTKLKNDMKKEEGSDDFLNDCMKYCKRIVQDMKYASSKDAERHGNELLQRVDDFSEDTGFKQDVNNLIREVVHLAEGFANDKVLFNVIAKGQTCFKHLVMNEYGNFVFKKRVMKDFFNIIIPSALKLVQYIPISRIEFQNADVDVLIENLVFESSASHDQSFLPYRLKIDNHNQIEFLNAYKFESDYSNEVTVKIEGLTLAVRDAGFYIRKKTGFWRFMDSGLVDLIMDGPGIDIDIDLAMSTDDEENDVTKDALFMVKDVRVHIRKLDFSTSGTRHGWLVGLIKPFIRGFIRRQVGLAVGAAIKEQLIYYEYQLRMLQHRFKTAYIANNGQASFESFFRAVFTANAGNNAGRKGQFEVVVGSQGPLAGIFTKASLQQELEESAAIAQEHGRPHSWKNDIFDL